MWYGHGRTGRTGGYGPVIGCPYGVCSILYRKSLSPFITLLDSGSNRFCALKLCDSNGLSVLMICVYMPGEHTQDAFNAYLSVLGELEGFIVCYGCDWNIIVGDFNVDFGRGGSLNDLLLDFLSDLNLSACDLQYQNDILYTYERDGLVRSWIDHVLSSHSFSYLVSDVSTQRSGSNLSDHFPLYFFASCYLFGCSLSYSFSFLFPLPLSLHSLAQSVFN